MHIKHAGTQTHSHTTYTYKDTHRYTHNDGEQEQDARVPVPARRARQERLGLGSGVRAPWLGRGHHTKAHEAREERLVHVAELLEGAVLDHGRQLVVVA